PAVWLATHGGLRQDLARTVLLDAPSAQVVEQRDSPGASAELVTDRRANTVIPVPPTVVKADPQPVIASMAPFSAMQPAAAPALAPVEPVSSKQRSLTLRLKQASWVEVTSADGEKLEYSLLAAGSERTYASDGEITLRIGNAEGAQIVADGKPVDLAPFRRANVAHLRMFGAHDSPSAVDS
ncbi:MAG: DUF4115 domain-containing protein, partial [Dokdonella sp.]